MKDKSLEFAGAAVSETMLLDAIMNAFEDLPEQANMSSQATKLLVASRIIKYIKNAEETRTQP